MASSKPVKEVKPVREVRQDDLSPAHLEWLVASRSKNQRAALRLFNLFEQYPELLKSPALARKAQKLVATCFSLWRAAFLADKKGTRHAVFEDARAFLAKMLVDNAITYPQDRGSREFTFDYYMNNATEALLRFAEQKWPRIDQAIGISRKALKRKITTAATNPAEFRWETVQYTFEMAVGCLEQHLKELH
jgi:hypothetical protein